MNNTINYEADFRFVNSGNVYIIEKDRYGIFRHFVAVDELTVQTCLMSEYKTQIINGKGEVIVQNFKNLDLKAVQELLTEVEGIDTKKQQLLANIDKALDEGNKVLFLALTEELKQLNGGIVENGVA
jgi:hypothetical protein